LIAKYKLIEGYEKFKGNVSMTHPIIKAWRHSVEQARKDEQERTMAKYICSRCGRPIVGMVSTQNILCRVCTRDLFGDD